MTGGLNMEKLFLRTLVLVSALIVLGIFKPSPVQAQCFHLGQAFECNGLPEGTSSISFNPDGTINLSNGQIVSGDFFNTLFRVPGLDTTLTQIIPITPDRPPITFLPTTADGINALTAFSHALGDSYEELDKKIMHGLSFKVPSDYSSVVSLANYYAKKALTMPYDPELARQLLKEAGWPETPSGERQYVEGDAQPTREQPFQGGIEFEVARSVSLGVRYIHRSMPRVLEDVGTLSLTEYEGAPTQGEGVGKGISLRDVQDVKISLENGIDNMDSEAAPIPALPFLPSIEPPSVTPAPFIQPSEPADNREVM